jgi:hypothetical protein
MTSSSAAIAALRTGGYALTGSTTRDRCRGTVESSSFEPRSMSSKLGLATYQGTTSVRLPVVLPLTESQLKGVK